MSKEIRAYRIALNVGFLLWWLRIVQQWWRGESGELQLAMAIVWLPGAMYVLWWGRDRVRSVEQWYWEVIMVSLVLFAVLGASKVVVMIIGSLL